jgi:hypothetical protein
MVREDMGQIFVNAKRFNVRESTIFAAAKKLHVRPLTSRAVYISEALTWETLHVSLQKILKTQYNVLTGRAPATEELSHEDSRIRKAAKKESATFKGWLQKKLDEIVNHHDA